MSIIVLRKDEEILYRLARELQKRIPSFKPHSLDGNLLGFAYKDLETFLEKDPQTPFIGRRKLRKYSRERPEELQRFLSFWTGSWLEKWRERVKLLHRTPNLPKCCKERVRRAKDLYRKMDHREDLKRMVVKRLVDRGEICMPPKIADTLMVREILRRLPSEGTDETELNPVEILSALIPRITRLSIEKEPLLYLKVSHRKKTHEF